MMVELVVTDILCKASDDRAYVMILKERDGNRKIMVAIGANEAQAIAFALKGIATKRPITHDLFRSLANALGATMKCATIGKISDGTFYSQLLYQQGDAICQIDSRTSDAVAIALRAGAPIYIDEELLNRVGVHDVFNGAISVPISVADTDTLRTVLDKAVKEENYELAMKIKEEIDSRTNEEFSSDEPHDNI
ncbi:MAG: bifunctional nuclease family protein [Bacteroidaceae bacterium]|nr:bifunctional nuclease family protein [Bacteroidaceae bacterium]